MNRQKRGEDLRDRMMAYIREECTAGIPPTIREIQTHCNVSSTSLVNYHLHRLERDGRILRSPKKSRAIIVV